MRPQDFISRMIDVFALNLGSFGIVKPKTFADAHNCIALAAVGCTDIETNGYRWSIRTSSTLGYIVIEASLSDGISDLVASVCFHTDSPDQLIASWHKSYIDSPESQMNMLAMLTLKTNNRVRALA